MTAHPKLVTFGIGLAITFVIGTAIGMVNTPPAYAAHGISYGWVTSPSAPSMKIVVAGSATSVAKLSRWIFSSKSTTF